MGAAEEQYEEPAAGALLTDKLASIENSVHDLRTLARPGQMSSDLRERRFVERTLQTAIQAALDAASIILSDRQLDEPRTSDDLFAQLTEDGSLSEGLSASLQSLNELRKTLVHGDAEIQVLEEVIAHRLDDLLAFTRAIGQAVQPPGEPGAVAAALSTLGFGPIDGELVMEAAVAVHHPEPTSAGDPAIAVADTARALRQTITFLKSAGRFPHISLLPDPRVLPILAGFFRQHPRPRSRSRLLLVRWLWRWAIGEAHRSEPDFLNRSLDAIRSEHDEEQTVQRLLSAVRERPGGELPLRPFDLLTTRSKLQLAALAALAPRHLVTGEKLDVGSLCDQPAGLATPVFGPDDRGEGGLANRLLHPPLDGEPLRDLITTCVDETVLRSHGISRPARDALLRGDGDTFVRLREPDVQIVTESFLASRAVWKAWDRDRPSLAALIVADE